MDETRKPVVLAVDDDAAILRLITIVLERSGMEVVAVASGSAAITALSDRVYDAVILDLTMPLVSGFEVISYLRHAKPAMLRRVVVITAMSDSAVRRLDHSLVFSVIAKPFDIAALAAKVALCIENGKAGIAISAAADVAIPIRNEAEASTPVESLRTESEDFLKPVAALETSTMVPGEEVLDAGQNAISTPAMDDANPDPK